MYEFPLLVFFALLICMRYAHIVIRTQCLFGPVSSMILNLFTVLADRNSLSSYQVPTSHPTHSSHTHTPLTHPTLHTEPFLLSDGVNCGRVRGDHAYCWNCATAQSKEGILLLSKTSK